MTQPVPGRGSPPRCPPELPAWQSERRGCLPGASSQVPVASSCGGEQGGEGARHPLLSAAATRAHCGDVAGAVGAPPLVLAPLATRGPGSAVSSHGENWGRSRENSVPRPHSVTPSLASAFSAGWLECGSEREGLPSPMPPAGPPLRSPASAPRQPGPDVAGTLSSRRAPPPEDPPPPEARSAPSGEPRRGSPNAPSGPPW